MPATHAGHATRATRGARTVMPPVARVATLAMLSTSLALAWACGGSAPAVQAETTAARTAAAPSAGEQLYARCAACHQADGAGIPGGLRGLAGSALATAANAEVPIRIVLHGVQGPLTVNGTRYDGLMLPYGTGVAMTDDEVAGVLSYVRQAWGNAAPAVTAAEVARVRAVPRAEGPVTGAELEALMR